MVIGCICLNVYIHAFDCVFVDACLCKCLFALYLCKFVYVSVYLVVFVYVNVYIYIIWLCVCCLSVLYLCKFVYVCVYL